MRVLIVDDNEDTCTLLCMGLERFGFYARSAGTVVDAKQILVDDRIDCILTDWNLGDVTADALIQAAGGRGIVLHTGDEDVLTALWAPHVSVLKKPAPLSAVMASLSASLELSQDVATARAR